jgi:hypothetical protein
MLMEESFQDVFSLTSRINEALHGLNELYPNGAIQLEELAAIGVLAAANKDPNYGTFVLLQLAKENRDLQDLYTQLSAEEIRQEAAKNATAN